MWVLAMANKKESCELILGGLQTFAEGALRHRAHLQFFLFMHLKSIIFQPVSYKTEASTDSRSRDQKSIVPFSSTYRRESYWSYMY